MLMLKPFFKYAEFNGRARRLEYWLFQLFQGIVYFALIFMIILSAGTAAVNRDIGAAFSSLGVLMILGIFALACFLPQLAVTVRRLHDIGRSAWWLLLYAPGVLSATSTIQSLTTLGQGRDAVLASMMHASLFGLIGSVCNLIMFGMMTLPGNRGSNRFGDDPKGDRAVDIARVFDAPDDELPAAEQPAQKEAYKPIFDFGPVSAEPARAAPVMREAAPVSPAYATPRTPARPTFGKR